MNYYFNYIPDYFCTMLQLDILSQFRLVMLDTLAPPTFMYQRPIKPIYVHSNMSKPMSKCSWNNNHHVVFDHIILEIHQIILPLPWKWPRTIGLLEACKWVQHRKCQYFFSIWCRFFYPQHCGSWQWAMWLLNCIPQGGCTLDCYNF